MGASPSAPAAASPSPSRVTVWRASTIFHVSGPTMSTTRRRTVLLPTSIAQRRMPIDERPAGSRRGVSRSTPGSLLPLERADVVYDLPALLLREVLPRGHGAPPVRNLPEDLAVALLLYGVGRPVRRLRRWQCRGRGTVAVSARAVTRHAIRLDQLLRIADALHGVLEALRLWRRDPRALRRHPPRPRHENESGPSDDRSEEHTSELQSRLHLVCRLLLEKKKRLRNRSHIQHHRRQP